MSSGITPMRRFKSMASRSNVRSSKRIVPLVGSSKPVSIFSVVDFPAPFRPSSPTNAPFSIVSETSATATLSPKRLVTWSRTIAAIYMYSAINAKERVGRVDVEPVTRVRNDVHPRGLGVRGALAVPRARSPLSSTCELPPATM